MRGGPTVSERIDRLTQENRALHAHVREALRRADYYFKLWHLQNHGVLPPHDALPSLCPLAVEEIEEEG